MQMKFLWLVSLYLLGSARGAPRQLEESPGSLNHPDAFQQFSGVQAPAEQTSGVQTPAGQTSGVQAPAEQALAGQAPAGPAPAEPAAPAPAAAEPAVAEQLAPGPLSGEQATGEQPSGSPAAPNAGPPIDCHTCSYMDSEGKCLRGEGSCTLQNSQQCMLKKIFEGGKLEFMVQGCENMCPSMSLFSHGTKMQLMCCRDVSFCNKT